jgi:ubiquinone biosynthesis protein
MAPRGELAHRQRLCQALERLGPVFVGFGRYLATRPDLFPPDYRRALGALSPQLDPLPAAAVREQMREELGVVADRAFTVVEEEPCEVGLLYQCHRAELADGQQVTVRVARPGAVGRFAADLDALGLLEEAFAEQAPVRLALANAVADYRRSVEQQADFIHQVKMLEALARDAVELDLIAVPRLYRGLSSAGVLTTEALPGRRLGDLLAPAGSATGTLPHVDRHALATRLCTAWLRLALAGQPFPVEPTPGRVVVLPDGRLAFDGLLSRLPADVRRHLWAYLVAAATTDPDGAAAHLFELMEKDPQRVHEDEFRRELRQVVLFRDGERQSPGKGDQLGELVRVHWRLAQEHGCRPPLHLLRFYRGLFIVSESADRLAPDRDSLRDALETARVLATLVQMRDLLTPSRLNESLERYAPVLMELPRKVDEALTLATGAGAHMHLHVRESPERRRHRNAAAATAALVLLLAGVGLLARYVAGAEALGEWGAKVGAGLFVLVGMLLLVRLSGRR